MNKKQARIKRNRKIKETKKITTENQAKTAYVRELRKIKLRYFTERETNDLSERFETGLPCVWCDDEIGETDIENQCFIGFYAGDSRPNYFVHKNHFFDDNDLSLPDARGKLLFCANKIRENEIFDRTGIKKPEDFDA